MNQLLVPAIQHIEATVFGPSDVLVQRWLDDDAGLSKEICQDLATDSAAIERRARFAECDNEADYVESESNSDSPMPAFLQDLIEQRVAARSHQFNSDPQPGQIRQIDQVIGPNGPINWELTKPLAVLLLEPTANKEIWWGFMVSPETAYASYWDMVLEPHVDGPVDPLASLVQFWNPVHVYLPSTAGVIGQLPPERVQVARAMAAEFVIATGNSPPEVVPQPGFILWRKTLQDLPVLTGTPLGIDEFADPRLWYQATYLAISQAVLEPVQLAQEAEKVQVVSDYHAIAIAELNDNQVIFGTLITIIAVAVIGEISNAALGGICSFMVAYLLNRYVFNANTEVNEVARYGTYVGVGLGVVGYMVAINIIGTDTELSGVGITSYLASIEKNTSVTTAGLAHIGATSGDLTHIGASSAVVAAGCLGCSVGGGMGAATMALPIKLVVAVAVAAAIAITAALVFYGANWLLRKRQK